MNIIIKNIIIVLKRFGVSCLLAVAGLAIAYSIFYMTVVQSYYDLRFDRNFEKANSIFMYSRIMPDMWHESLRVWISTIEPREAAERYPEIKNFCYLRLGNEKFDVKNEHTGETYFFHENITTSSVGFIEMFKPKIWYGDVKQAFTQGYAMLTESAAKQIFGDKDPLGQVINYSTSWWEGNNTLTVAAVCADFPDNCSLKNGIYTFQNELRQRGLTGWTTYFEIDPSNRDRLLTKMNDEQHMTKLAGKENEVWQFELTPLPDIHLRFPAVGEGNKTTVILLLSVGILLLVVSYINFLNFSIAMAPVRVKNINLRKILGENPFMLKLSVVMETVFLSCAAFLFSIFFIQILNTVAFKDFFIADAAISENPGLLLFAGVFSIISGFIAGIYPAYYTTSFDPVMAISGSYPLSSQNKWLKNILTGVQFIAAVFLITTMLFFNIQYNFMRNKDWGINTENVVYLNIDWDKQHFIDDFAAELKRNVNILDVTAGSRFPGQDINQGWGNIPFENTVIGMLNIWYVQPGFLDFFDINVAKGEGFKENDRNKIIFNRAFFKTYELNDDIVDEFKTIHVNNADHDLIGMVEDFNFKSLHGDVQPLAFVPLEGNMHYLNWLFIKTLDGANTCQTIDYINDTWKKFSNEPVEVMSLTETIKSLYKKEHNTTSLVSTGGIIAIIVAIIGLYGLVLFDAKARRKSIAIRKIHGATITEVILMLNQGIFVRFAVSCLVALPLSYYVVQRWLEDFAYKTPVYWWVFAVGALVVLIISLLTVSWESYKAASENPVEVIKTE